MSSTRRTSRHRTSSLWLLWSWRDLRRQWVTVTALALVIAIGTGASAALSSMSAWRRLSNDASYARFALHDLLLTFEESRPEAVDVLAAVRSVPHATAVDRMEVGLDLPAQIEVPTTAGTGQDTLPGLVVGVPLDGGGPLIDRLLVTSGRGLRADDAAGTVAVLDATSAESAGLPGTGTVRIAGGTRLPYVGSVRSAEHLMSDASGWFGQVERTVLYAPLPLVQRLAGAPGRIDRVALRLAPGTDADLLRTELETTLATRLPGSPVAIARGDEDPAFRMLYDDIDTDQRLWNVLSLMILLGAALATFSLTTRVVTAQRREMGIGLALGLRAPALAIRPTLFALQIALMGALAGVGVGILLGRIITGILADMIPLPVWLSPFQPGDYVRAALLGIAVPLVGVVHPVLRAMRLSPMDAIATSRATGGTTVSRGGRFAGWLRAVPLPGSSIARLPVRHVLRAPGRTLITSAGIGAAIAVLVVTSGLMDSFAAAADRGIAETDRGPATTTVALDSVHPVTAGEVRSIAGLPQVTAVQPTLLVGAVARPGSGAGADAGAEPLDLAVEVLDLDTALWAPTIEDAVAPGPPRGIVLARKAATDLGVGPGDEIRLEHPSWRGDGAVTTVTTAFTVAAVHPHPVRSLAFLDTSAASALGVAGLTNQLRVSPAPGVDEDELRRALLATPAVASVRSASEAADALRDAVREFVRMLTVVGVLVLLLALLIAVNAARISADERTREHATMFAFGLRTGTVTAMAMVESLLVGLLGTGLGVGLGAIGTHWAVVNLVTGTMPELDVRPTVAAATLLVALALGVLAVATAPLLTVRRLHRMDIPAALRVIE
ncbi:MAG: ABC transporter permease [Actinomycetales bacterium]|nr:ABC transporter permease [Actinomycetales bacterium]